jgi:hypothetical protein
MRARLLIALLPLLAACQRPDDPGAQGPNYQRSTSIDVVLAVGQQVRVDSLGVRFLGVRGDSRCAATVMCVWMGDGAVEIAYAAGADAPITDTLHTALDPKAVDYAGYTITLLDLSPYPYNPGPIPQDEYAATLRIARRPVSAAAR